MLCLAEARQGGNYAGFSLGDCLSAEILAYSEERSGMCFQSKSWKRSKIFLKPVSRYFDLKGIN